MGRALGKCFSSPPPSFEIRDKGVFHHRGNNLDHDLEFAEKYEKNAQISRFVLLFKVFSNGRLDNRGSGEETSFHHFSTDFDCGLNYVKKNHTSIGGFS